MERKPDPQQVEVITVQPQAMGLKDSRARMLLLVFFMLSPWIWVNYGLHVVQDFRVTIALYELVCCALPLIVFRVDKVPVWPLRVSMRTLILVILAANVFFLANFKTLYAHIMDWSVFGPRIRALQMGPNAEFWGYGIYLVFFNPLLEEGFWRGVVYREWRKLLGPWRANVISSFFFGAWHWIILQHFCTPAWAIGLSVLVMIGGSVFAYTYERTGTLGAAILLHGLGADLPLVFIVWQSVLYSQTLF